MVSSTDEISTVAVIGFGTMGIGIAQNFAEAGLHVRVIDDNAESLNVGMKQLRANIEVAANAGLIDQPDRVIQHVQLYSGDEFSLALQNVQVVVESVPEVLELKVRVFSMLDDLPADVLIGSNTSSFTVSQMTNAMQTPERVVGVHYFNPAHLIPAVEIHHGSQTSENAIEQMMALMNRVGKVPVRVRKEIPGFIINRLTGALEREIDLLLDEGIVTPEDLDSAVKASLGFRLACIGPMEAEDFIGLDTAYRVSNNVFKDLSNATRASEDLGKKVERGELGVKSGKGWYDYSTLTRKDIFAQRDQKLLRQLALYRAMQESSED